VRLVRRIDGSYEVQSEMGKLLSTHATEKSARNWVSKYSSMKKYSNDVNKIGGPDAMALLRKRINSKI
jgi:hypothetical protein